MRRIHSVAAIVSGGGFIRKMDDEFEEWKDHMASIIEFDRTVKELELRASSSFNELENTRQAISSQARDGGMEAPISTGLAKYNTLVAESEKQQEEVNDALNRRSRAQDSFHAFLRMRIYLYIEKPLVQEALSWFQLS